MWGKGIKRTGAGCPPPFLIPLSRVPLSPFPCPNSLVQHSLVQHSLVQHSLVQHSLVQHSSAPHSLRPLNGRKNGLAQVARKNAEKSLCVPTAPHIPFRAGGRGTSTRLPGRSAVGVRVRRDLCLPNPEGSQNLPLLERAAKPPVIIAHASHAPRQGTRRRIFAHAGPP